MVPDSNGHHAQIMKGVLDMCLLATIAEKPNYGYGMVQQLNGRGWVIAHENSIYPVLKRLTKEGYIESELVPSTSGPARKYYSSTPSGEEVLAMWTADWRNVRDGVDAVLSNGDAAKTTKKKSPTKKSSRKKAGGK